MKKSSLAALANNSCETRDPRIHVAGFTRAASGVNDNLAPLYSQVAKEYILNFFPELATYFAVSLQYIS